MPEGIGTETSEESNRKTPPSRPVADGADRLNSLFKQLASSHSVWRAADKAHGGSSPSEREPEEAKNHSFAKAANLNPKERISRYLERLEDVLSKTPNPDSKLADSQLAPHSRLQERLIKKYSIDTSNSELAEKIAYGLFLSEKQADMERGGAGEIQQKDFKDVKQDYINLVEEKASLQRSSLSQWTTYLLKNDAQYPTWFRYLATREVLKMGEFDRDTPKFAKRSNTTVAPFPELNAEALGFVYKALTDPTDPVVKRVFTESPELVEPLRQALGAKSFAKLYAVALVATNQTVDRSRLEGEWRKYDRDSDYHILEEDLARKGTGWCTASGSARAHLKGGDFYVFYTKDNNDQCTVPRVAIRMNGNQIAEIRGIATGQELEPEFVDIVEEKGKSLGGYDTYKKTITDMRQLTEIDKRCFVRDKEGAITETLEPTPPLSIEELRFLYQVDERIKSFGYREDSRIKHFLGIRSDKYGDYALMYDVEKAQVTDDKTQISEATRVYIGDLSDEDYEILNQRKEPLIIVGHCDFSRCTSLTKIPEGIVFKGSASFRDCTSLTTIPEGVVFKGGAYFEGCTSLTTISEGVVFHGDASFEDCTALTTISEGVVFNGYAKFSGCTALTTIPEGVVFNGNANFAGCTSLTNIPEGVVFHGHAYFPGCTSLATISEGTVFPGDADFSDCTSLTTISEGVVFHWDANFTGCTSLTNIPERVVFNGDANFHGCTSLTTISEEVVFHGHADFAGCTALTTISEGVVFNEYADFFGCTALTNIPEGVVFNGEANFKGCTSLTNIPEAL